MTDQELHSEAEENGASETSSMSGVDPSPQEDQALFASIEPLAQEEDDDDEGWQPATPRSGLPVDTSWMSGDSGDDVDAALAAVASLSMITDREADDLARTETTEAPKHAGRPAFGEGIPSPPSITLKRGQLASVVPALLLIAGGAAWTLTNTTGGQVESVILVGGAVGLIALMFLLAWLNSGRWSRGLLFFAVFTIIAAGLIIFMTQTPGLDLPTAYPLLLTAPGLAFILTAALGRPASSRLLIPGVLLIASAAVGIAFNAGLIPLDLVPILPILAPGVGGIVLLFCVFAYFVRRRA